MKKYFIYLLAAVAAIAAVSCQKIENEQASNLRTVTAGFDKESRTTLNGLSVSWEVGDEIKVMNDAGQSELHTIVASELNDGKVKFTTSLDGQLYAIHGDADASVVEGEVSFTIPSSQSGAFKDANICVAKLDANNHFAFKNATAIIKVIGSNNLNYFRIYNGKNEFFSKGTQPTSGSKWNDFASQISVLDGTYFIALSAGTYFFHAENYASDGKQTPKVITKNYNPSQKEIATGKIYSVTPSFISY